VHGSLPTSLLIQFGAKLRGGKAPKTFTYRGFAMAREGNFRRPSHLRTRLDLAVRRIFSVSRASRKALQCGQFTVNEI
jgi:hypothetical protein